MDVSVKTEEQTSVRVKLLQEAAVMAQFRHPNVARLHGIADTDNAVRSISQSSHNHQNNLFLVMDACSEDGAYRHLYMLSK